MLLLMVGASLVITGTSAAMFILKHDLSFKELTQQADPFWPAASGDDR